MLIESTLIFMGKINKQNINLFEVKSHDAEDCVCVLDSTRVNILWREPELFLAHSSLS